MSPDGALLKKRELGRAKKQELVGQAPAHIKIQSILMELRRHSVGWGVSYSGRTDLTADVRGPIYATSVQLSAK